MNSLLLANADFDFLLHEVSGRGEPEDYPDRLVLDAIDADAPDVAYVDQNTVSKLAKSNALWPVKNCGGAVGSNALDSAIQKHAVTETVKWGLPYDINPIMFAYNQEMLRELGWTENEVTSLPQRISQGDYTLDDMVLTGIEALSRNVTTSGYGFAPLFSSLTFAALYEAFREPYTVDVTRYNTIDTLAISNLLYFWRKLSTENLTHTEYLQHSPTVSPELRMDAIVNGRTLFALIEAEEWINLQKFSQSNSPIGIALVPTGLKGRSARSVVPSIGFHVIFGHESTGNTYQIKSCARIATLHASDQPKQDAQLFGLPTISGGKVFFNDSWPVVDIEQFTFPASEQRYWQVLFTTLSKIAAEMIRENYSENHAVRTTTAKLEEQLIYIRHRIRR